MRVTTMFNPVRTTVRSEHSGRKDGGLEKKNDQQGQTAEETWSFSLKGGVTFSTDYKVQTLG